MFKIFIVEDELTMTYRTQNIIRKYMAMNVFTTDDATSVLSIPIEAASPHLTIIGHQPAAF